MQVITDNEYLQDMIHTAARKRAADVVEVVRCKDCKHFVCVQKMNVCNSFFGMTIIEDDGSDFCSRGERKQP